MSLSASRCSNLPFPHSLMWTGCKSRLPQLPSATDKAKVKQQESRQATLYVSFNGVSIQRLVPPPKQFFSPTVKSAVEAVSGAQCCRALLSASAPTGAIQSPCSSTTRRSCSELMIIKDAALRFGLFNSVPSHLVSLPRDKDGDPTISHEMFAKPFFREDRGHRVPGRSSVSNLGRGAADSLRPT